METVCATPKDRARKTVKCVLQGLSDNGKAASIAVAMGVSEPTITRLKNDHLQNFALVLAHLGLKVVPAEYKCYNPDYVESILTLARAQLLENSAPKTLEWEE
jgi:hypothetical protein